MTTNSSTIISIFGPLLLALFTIILASYASVKLVKAIKLIDYPGSAPHKQHKKPTPIAGGIALVITLFITSLILGTYKDWNVFVSYIAAIPVFLFGLWDDKKNLPPLVKLSGQLIAAVLLIYLDVYIRIFESPEFFLRTSSRLDIYIDWLLTIIWVVGITNAFNFVDSMDGLAVGLGGMGAVFFMLATLDSQQLTLATHGAVLAGICAGLYFLNAPPALLFLGDSGAQTLGFVLAVLAIAYIPQEANQSSSWFFPIFILGVPIFDAVLVIFSRIRRKRPIYNAARDHTYHRLKKLGFAANRSVLIMQGCALLLSCLAFIILKQPPLIANLTFIIILILAGLALIFLDHRNFWT